MLVDVEDGDGEFRERLLRRVSWRPGAEGAPLEEVEGVFDLEFGYEEAGAMRRDCWGGFDGQS